MSHGSLYSVSFPLCNLFLHLNDHLILKVWGIKCIYSGFMALSHKTEKGCDCCINCSPWMQQSNTEAFTGTLIRHIMMLDGNLQAWNIASLNESKAINAVCWKCPLCACGHGSGSWSGASVLHLHAFYSSWSSFISQELNCFKKHGVHKGRLTLLRRHLNPSRVKYPWRQDWVARYNILDSKLRILSSPSCLTLMSGCTQHLFLIKQLPFGTMWSCYGNLGTMLIISNHTKRTQRPPEHNSVLSVSMGMWCGGKNMTNTGHP